MFPSSICDLLGSIVCVITGLALLPTWLCAGAGTDSATTRAATANEVKTMQDRAGMLYCFPRIIYRLNRDFLSRLRLRGIIPPQKSTSGLKELAEKLREPVANNIVGSSCWYARTGREAEWDVQLRSAGAASAGRSPAAKDSHPGG